MQRKSLYRPMTDKEREEHRRSQQFADSYLDEPRVRPAKPPKGAKRKAKR